MVADKLNDFAWKKISELKENIKTNEETNNFISSYLKEIEKSDGKMEDRYVEMYNINLLKFIFRI